MVTDNHYRWDFIGLSTDEKPTPATSEKVVDGSTFYCSDTSKLYVYCTNNWYERKPLGGGGGTSYEAGEGIDITDNTISVDTEVIQPLLTAGDNITITDNVISATSDGGVTVLTSDDYNYPADNPDGVALWLLPSGWYTKSESSVGVYTKNSNRDIYTTSTYFISPVNKTTSGTNETIMVISQRSGNGEIYFDELFTETGASSLGSTYQIPYVKSIVNNLTTTQAGYVLDARQGKKLKELIDNQGNTLSATAPATTTVGVLGQLYTDTTNMHTYQLTAIDTTDPSNPIYTWTQRW